MTETPVPCGVPGCKSLDTQPAFADGRKTNLCPLHMAQFQDLGWLTESGRSASLEEFQNTVRFTK